MGNKWCASCKSQSQLLQKPPATGNPPEGQAERTGTRPETRDGEAQSVAIATTLTTSVIERQLVAESEIQPEPNDAKGHLAKIDFSSAAVAGSVPAPSASSAPRKIAFKEDAETEEEEEEEGEVDFRRTHILHSPYKCTSSVLEKMAAERKERDRWQDFSEEIERRARYIVDINLFIAAKVLYPALERFRQEQIQTRNNGEGREQLMR